MRPISGDETFLFYPFRLLSSSGQPFIEGDQSELTVIRKKCRCVKGVDDGSNGSIVENTVSRELKYMEDPIRTPH